MGERDNVSAAVPYIVYESAMARSERHIRRLLWLLLCVVVLLAVTNLAWMHMWNSYEYTGYTYSQDGEGINVIGDRNGVDYNVPEVDGQETD